MRSFAFFIMFCKAAGHLILDLAADGLTDDKKQYAYTRIARRCIGEGKLEVHFIKANLRG